jgi:hypothetical protein
MRTPGAALQGALKVLNGFSTPHRTWLEVEGLGVFTASAVLMRAWNGNTPACRFVMVEEPLYHT